MYDKLGRLSRIATGRSAANGSFTMRATKALGDTHAPRLIVRLFYKSKWYYLTDQYLTFRSSVADFGKIKFNEQALYKIGTVPYHGNNQAVTSRTPVMLASINQPIMMSAAAATTTQPSTTSIQKLNLDLTKLRTQNTTVVKERDKLKNDIKTRDAQITAKTKEIQTVRTSLLSQHATQIKAKEAVIADLQKQLKAKPKPVITSAVKAAAPVRKDKISLNELAFETGSQVESAQRRLAAQKSSLRLSKVSLQLKGIADPSGGAIQLPEKAEVANLSSGMSVVNMDFVTRTPRQAEPTTTEEKAEAPEKLPSLLNLTETRARQQLADSGFPFKIYYQALGPKRKASLGRVIHQSPVAGTALNEDTVIKLIVGKPTQ